MLPITETDEDKLRYKIENMLEPDTEYVFKMRAVYPDGPGVFSDACITKTLPDGAFILFILSTRRRFLLELLFKLFVLMPFTFR